MCPICPNIITVKNFAIDVFSGCPVLSNSLIIHGQVFSPAHCFWPSWMPYLGILPAAPVNSLPHYNKTRLCLISQRTSPVKPCWPFNPHGCRLFTPLNHALLPQLSKAFFWILPGFPNILVHSHFSLPLLKLLWDSGKLSLHFSLEFWKFIMFKNVLEKSFLMVRHQKPRDY